MAVSPRVNPRPNPAALATFFAARTPPVGSNTVPLKPTRFRKLRLPRRPPGRVISFCELACSAPPGAEPLWIGSFCISYLVYLAFGFCLRVDSFAPDAFMVSFPWKQQPIENQISYVTAKLGSSGQVEAEVLSAEDAA